MRKPSTMMALTSWHRRAMRGENPIRHESDPQCGWYVYRKVKNGPWIPVTIFCDRDIDEHGELTRDERITADVFGEIMDPTPIWTWLRPVTKEKHDEILQFRMNNQHFIENETRIDLANIPTRPRG